VSGSAGSSAKPWISSNAPASFQLRRPGRPESPRPASAFLPGVRSGYDQGCAWRASAVSFVVSRWRKDMNSRGLFRVLIVATLVIAGGCGTKSAPPPVVHGLTLNGFDKAGVSGRAGSSARTFHRSRRRVSNSVSRGGPGVLGPASALFQGMAFGYDHRGRSVAGSADHCPMEKRRPRW